MKPFLPPPPQQFFIGFTLSLLLLSIFFIGFTLSLLSIISSSCLLLLLLLPQTRFRFQESLLRAQRENVREEGDEDGVILDMLSLERNHILVKSYVVGGPDERILPPRWVFIFG